MKNIKENHIWQVWLTLLSWQNQHTLQVRVEVWTVNQCYTNCINVFPSVGALTAATPQCQPLDKLPCARCPGFALLTLIITVPATTTVRNWTPVLLICAAGAKTHKSPLLRSWSLKVQLTGSEAQIKSSDGRGWRITLYDTTGNLQCNFVLWISTNKTLASSYWYLNVETVEEITLWGTRERQLMLPLFW